MSAGLLLENVSFEFGHKKSDFRLQPLDISVKPGKTLAIIGPNGAGKSTLLSLIGGHNRVERGGSIFLNDINITDKPPGQRGVVSVFQDQALFPHMSVRQNLEAARTFSRKSAKLNGDFEEISDFERWFGLSGISDCYPHELSSGQRQRVSVGRALLADPEVLLLDEATSALDIECKREVRKMLLTVRLKRPQIIVILITHDYEFAFSSADEIVVMASGQVLGQSDTEKLLFSPPTLEIARILDRFNCLEGKLQSKGVFADNTGTIVLHRSEAEMARFEGNQECVAVLPTHSISVPPQFTGGLELACSLERFEIRAGYGRIHLKTGGVELFSDALPSQFAEIKRMAHAGKLKCQIDLTQVTFFSKTQH